MLGRFELYSAVNAVRLCRVAPYTPKKPSGLATTAGGGKRGAPWNQNAEVDRKLRFEWMDVRGRLAEWGEPLSESDLAQELDQRSAAPPVAGFS